MMRMTPSTAASSQSQSRQQQQQRRKKPTWCRSVITNTFFRGFTLLCSLMIFVRLQLWSFFDVDVDVDVDPTVAADLPGGNNDNNNNFGRSRDNNLLPVDDDFAAGEGYYNNNNNHAHDDDDGGGGGGTAFCLLTMDDNDLLPEWVGYHYHVMRMRRLIVAVDPNSETSPKDVLRSWTKEGSNGTFDLKVDVWENDVFMPGYFRRKDYSRYNLSSIITVDPEDKDKANGTAADIELKLVRTQFHDESFTKEHPDEVRKAVHKVSDHRFRQPYFMYRCFETIKEERKKQNSDISWALHVDSDEYLVPNPWIKHHLVHDLPVNNTIFFDRDALDSIFPAKPGPNSLVEFFHRYLRRGDEMFGAANAGEKGPMEPGCVLVPRVRFGAKEDDDLRRGDGDEDPDDDDDTTVAFSESSSSSSAGGGGGGEEETTHHHLLRTTWDHRRFESLRWKYHQDFAEPHPKGGMKGMIDVDKHELSPPEARLHANIHRPSIRCRANSVNDPLENQYQREQPLAIYHYLGSLERYLFRGDVRRKTNKHASTSERASHAKGDVYGPEEEEERRWWIKGWFDSFVETHGADAAYSVFGAEYAERRVVPES